MIDLNTEPLINMNQAAEEIRKIADLPSVSKSNIYRWCADGVRGRKLDSIEIGGRRLTSREAIHRFIQPTA